VELPDLGSSKPTRHFIGKNDDPARHGSRTKITSSTEDVGAGGSTAGTAIEKHSISGSSDGGAKEASLVFLVALD
jgi:hypothetical protein